MQGSDTGIPTQSVIDMHGVCSGERVKVAVYGVGVRSEVGQYNSMYTCTCTCV